MSLTSGRRQRETLSGVDNAPSPVPDSRTRREGANERVRMPGPKLDRRSLIQNLLRGGLALSLAPGFAEGAWAVAVSAPRTVRSGHGAMIAVIADAILPRSETPSASDVGVPPWIDVVVANYFSDIQRASFLADLGAIDEFARSTSGGLETAIASLDAACGSSNLTPAQRGYVQLKELVIVGYFTSKPVQQDILKVVIVPGRFDGNVPIPPPSHGQ
jgi:gluconate 2-dehydrogenase gamma chain